MDIFENIGVGLNQDEGMNMKKATARQSVAEFEGRNAKLKSDVSELILQLGTEYYRIHREDASVEFADIIANINELNRQYRENCAEIERLKAFNVCGVCGTEVARGFSFCPKCGIRLEASTGEGTVTCSQNTAAPESPSRPVVQHCSRCGAELRPNAKFCSKCGNKLG